MEATTEPLAQRLLAVAEACGEALSPEGPVGGEADADLLAALEAAFRLGDRVEAILARLAGEVVERSRSSLGAEGLARRYGEASPRSLLALAGRTTRARAARLCRVGEATRERTALTGETLPPEYETVAGALCAGVLPVESADVIVGGLREASDRADPQARSAAERSLVDFAAAAPTDDVRRLAIRWRDALDPDGVEPREDELVRRRGLKRTVRSNGMIRYVLDADPLSAGYLDAALDAQVGQAIRGPRFAPGNSAGASPGSSVGGSPTDAAGCSPATGAAVVGDAATLGDAVTLGEAHEYGATSDGSVAVPGADRLGEVDPRTLSQIRADALVELARHGLSCREAPGAVPAATLVVRMDLDDLRSDGGQARIDGVEQPISATTARILAADAEIIPAVLGGAGEVLDLGTSRRLFSRAQRLALAERDGGCAWPHCPHPPGYTEAHHIRWWARDGGTTDVSNGILLCSMHHHRVHRDRWEIRVRGGTPWFTPPSSIDARRTPRRGGRLPEPYRDGAVRRAP